MFENISMKRPSLLTRIRKSVLKKLTSVALVLTMLLNMFMPIVISLFGLGYGVSAYADVPYIKVDDLEKLIELSKKTNEEIDHDTYDNHASKLGPRFLAKQERDRAIFNLQYARRELPGKRYTNLALDFYGEAPLYQEAQQDSDFYYINDFHFEDIEVSSLYFIDQLEDKGLFEGVKRLGDQFVERDEVNDQLLAIANRIYHIQYELEDDRDRAFYDNAISEMRRLSLTPGSTLTETQIAQIDKNIIWPEVHYLNQNAIKKLNKQITETKDKKKLKELKNKLAALKEAKVIVPRVYLTQADRDRFGDHDEVIHARNIDADTSKISVSNGSILAEDSLKIKVGELKLDGGRVDTNTDKEATFQARSIKTSADISSENIRIRTIDLHNDGKIGIGTENLHVIASGDLINKGSIDATHIQHGGNRITNDGAIGESSEDVSMDLEFLDNHNIIDGSEIKITGHADSRIRNDSLIGSTKTKKLEIADGELNNKDGARIESTEVIIGTGITINSGTIDGEKIVLDSSETANRMYNNGVIGNNHSESTEISFDSVDNRGTIHGKTININSDRFGNDGEFGTSNTESNTISVKELENAGSVNSQDIAINGETLNNAGSIGDTNTNNVTLTANTLENSGNIGTGSTTSTTITSDDVVNSGEMDSKTLSVTGNKLENTGTIGQETEKNQLSFQDMNNGSEIKGKEVQITSKDSEQDSKLVNTGKIGGSGTDNVEIGITHIENDGGELESEDLAVESKSLSITGTGSKITATDNGIISHSDGLTLNTDLTTEGNVEFNGGTVNIGEGIGRYHNRAIEKQRALCKEASYSNPICNELDNIEKKPVNVSETYADINAKGDLTIDAKQVAITGDIKSDGKLTIKGSQFVSFSHTYDEDKNTVLIDASKHKKSESRKETQSYQITGNDGVEVSSENGEVYLDTDVISHGDLLIVGGGSVTVPSRMDYLITDEWRKKVKRKTFSTKTTIYKNHDETHTAYGTKITADGKITITSAAGNILFSGSSIEGSDIEIMSGAALSILNTKNSNACARDKKSKEKLGIGLGGIGAFFTSGAMGYFANWKAKTNVKCTYETPLATNIKGDNGVTLGSGNDLEIRSSKVETENNALITIDSKGKLSLTTDKFVNHYSKSSSSEGPVTQSSSGSGHFIENPSYDHLGSDNIKYKHVKGFVVQFENTQNFNEAVAQAANKHGLEWLGELQKRDDVEWDKIDLAYEEWNYSHQGLSPAASVVLTIAVAYATAGAGAALVGPAASGLTTAMANAAVTSIATKAAHAVASNPTDPGAALAELGSDENVRDLAETLVVTAVTYGVSNYLSNLENGYSIDINKANDLQEHLRNNLAHATIRVAVNSGMTGEDFFKKLGPAYRQAAIDALGAVAANKIGNAYKEYLKDGSNTSLAYVSHKFAHAVLGCGIGEISDQNCEAGATGAVVGEITAEYQRNKIDEFITEFHNNPELFNNDPVAADKVIQQMKRDGINLAKLNAALLALSLGFDADEVSTAAHTGGNAAEHNALHFIIPAIYILYRAVDAALAGKSFVENFLKLMEYDSLSEEEQDELLLSIAEDLALGLIGGKTIAKITKKLSEKLGISEADAEKLLKEIEQKADCGCFAPGTQVLTKTGYQAIESIQVGDLLAAKDEATGDIDWKPVLKRHIYKNRPYNQLTLTQDGKAPVSLTVTKDHPFYVTDKGWTWSSDLEIGDLVTNKDGSSHTVTGWKPLGKLGTTYNFDVKDYESYFVSQQNIWVHNGDPCDFTKVKDKMGLPKPKTAAQWRNTPGRASGGTNLPEIRDGNWLKGTHGNVGNVPGQVAKGLNGKNFNDFNEFRKAFWKEVSKHPDVLGDKFSSRSIDRMREGKAPFVSGTQALGGQLNYVLHHKVPIQHGGSVYDFNNIVVITPKLHKEILDGSYHFGSKN